MRTIESIATVDEQVMAVFRMPPDVTPGAHKVVEVMDERTFIRPRKRYPFLTCLV
jgi:hypothetical protein